MSRILLVGGAGYIGSVLAPKLKDRDHDVVVLDALWFDNHVRKDIPVYKGDVFDIRFDRLGYFDTVVFLAGLSNDPMAEYSPSKNFVENAAAPAFLAFMAKKTGVKRFVYASSCSIYGLADDGLCYEEDPTFPEFPYALSKLQGERAVMQLQDDNFSVISLRKGTVCGYSPRMRLDLIVNTMFRDALCSWEINIKNPSIWRPILSIQDAAQAYIRAIEASPKVSGTFNIASGNYTVGAVADIVVEEVRRLCQWSFDPLMRVANIPDKRSYKVSTARAKEELGFEAQDDVRTIVHDLYAHRYEFKDIDNPEYYNIKRLTELAFR